MKYGLTYREENGLLYPELTLPEQTHYPIGKYGDMRLAFIKKRRKGTYTTLLTQFRLNEYLHEIDVEAHRLLDIIIPQMAKDRGIDETLKSADMLRWVAEMNAIKASAEEIICKEIIYA